MVAPSREPRESITLSSWHPHFGQRIGKNTPYSVLPHSYTLNMGSVKEERRKLSLSAPEAIQHVEFTDSHALGDRLSNVFFGLFHRFPQRTSAGQESGDRSGIG